uniref:Endoplasmic reticulum metallopeptidase 1-like C-terminal domain-containing protein n=1 Tax=Panagrolaimus superbus TaxID=310955 RepID=A0A914YH82_9BILA
MIRAKRIEDDSLDFYEAKIELKSKVLDNHGRLRYEFLFKGSDQMSVIYEHPETAKSIGWRLINSPSKEFVSNSSFIFLSCGGENCGEWNIEIIFENMEKSESIEVMVSSHTLHGPKMYSNTLKKMHENIRKNREKGDWKWAMTASSWTVDLLKQSF